MGFSEAMELNRRGQAPRSPGHQEPALSKIPGVLALSCASAAVWLVIAADPSGSPFWKTPLGLWMALRVRDFDLRSLLTYHLLHGNGLHLVLNLACLFYAGRRLEIRFGTLRFLSFYLASAILLGLGTYGIGLAFPPVEDPAGPVSFGASGTALACAAASALVFEDRPVFGIFTERYLAWSGMFLGAALIVLLEESHRGAHPGSPALLTPQLLGIGGGIAGAFALLRWERSSLRAADPPEKGGRKARETIPDIRGRVDRLLEKISRGGWKGLTEEERDFLREASKHFRNPM